MEPSKSLSIIYEKSKHFITFPTTGAYGGPATDGNGVIVHFFIEYGSIPHSINIPIADKKVDLKHEEKISRGDLTREVQATMYLSPERAIVIGEWLIRHGQKALEIRGGSPNEE